MATSHERNADSSDRGDSSAESVAPVESLSPHEAEIRAKMAACVEMAQSLADREMPGVGRIVRKHKDGTFYTEIYGLGKQVDDNGNSSPIVAGSWKATGISLKYSSSEDGLPLGQDSTLSVDTVKTNSLRIIDRAGSVDDGKPTHDDRRSVMFFQSPGRAPSTSATTIRNGNGPGDRDAYDKGSSEVKGPVDSIIAEFLASGNRFAAEHPEPTNDLVAQLAASKAKELLDQQEAARRAVEAASRGPVYEEPASWHTLPSEAAPKQPLVVNIPQRDVTGYRLDGYTSGRVVTPQKPSQSFLNAYPEYANKAPYVPDAKRKHVGHKILAAGGRLKKRLKGSK